MADRDGVSISEDERRQTEDKHGQSSRNAEVQTALLNEQGWDGKLRLAPRAVITNPEALSDPEFSDEDAPPVELIDADEDLLRDYEDDTEDIDLVHCKITSMAALELQRFQKVERLCLRQNQISEPALPENLAPTLKELDLYDNLITHIKGLDDLSQLESLDLSFNKIKQIKHVGHLMLLRDLYFVQNRIQRIENLDGLVNLRNLELAANRIRDIDNLDTLVGLEQLWLGKNKITELKNLSSLVNLKVLSIQSNRLTRIAGLDTLPQLEELYISHNSLTEITGLESNTALRVLDISGNQILHLRGLSQQAQLEELWASSNRFASFQEVEDQLKDKTFLQTVYFEGNPLQLKGPAVYRNKIRLALPQVVQIDATCVRLS